MFLRNSRARSRAVIIADAVDSAAMHSIPPAGIHPTMPPPPAHRAKRAIGFALAGLVLLGLAVAASLSLRPDAAQVFSGRNDYEIGAATSRLLFGLSGAAQLAGIVYAAISFRQARGMSSLAFAIAASWIGVIAWWLT
jgi:hypothetical protein